MARPSRVLHERDRAVGRRSPSRARAPARSSRRPARTSTCRTRRSLHDVARGRPWRASPARLARVSFTGELAYEMNVAGMDGLRDVGGAVRGRAGRRRHAVRHGGHARAARGEGLRDRGTGDGRHGHAGRPRDVVDRERRRATSSGGARSTPALVRPAASSSLACCRRTRTCSCPRVPQLVLEGTAGRPGTSRRAIGAPRSGARSRSRCSPAGRAARRHSSSAASESDGRRDGHLTGALRPGGGSTRWMKPASRSPSRGSPRRSTCDVGSPEDLDLPLVPNTWTAAPVAGSGCGWGRTSGWLLVPMGPRRR